MRRIARTRICRRCPPAYEYLGAAGNRREARDIAIEGDTRRIIYLATKNLTFRSETKRTPWLKIYTGWIRDEIHRDSI